MHDEMLLEGTLGNLVLMDFTNYPETIFREEDYTKVQPKEILGLLKQEKDQNSLLKIYFRLLNESSPKIDPKTNVTTFLKVHLSQIHVNFMMQPVMRLLDYVLVQALGPLTTPELFMDETVLEKTMKEKMEKKKREIKDPFAPLRAQGRAKVRKELMNPKGIMMDILIEKPLIHLKPRHDAEEFLQISLGNIKITNARVKNEERIVENSGTGVHETFSEQFNICMQDM